MANQVWLVTGCSSGVGAALSQQIINQGHILVATARKVESLSFLPNNDHVLKLSLDVTKPEQIDAALQATIQRFGRLDVLVNNAGYTKRGVTEAVPMEELREMFETNFWGAVNATQKVLKVFRESNVKNGRIGGTVVQISSIGGRIAFPGSAAYHSSKFALEAFTETISQEVDPTWNIRFLIVEPGGTKTNFVSSSNKSVSTLHPAYNNPELPINQLFKLVNDPTLEDRYADANKVAKVIVEIVQKDTMPLRLPTGVDAWAIIKRREVQKMEELEEWREVSESVGGGTLLSTGSVK